MEKLVAFIPDLLGRLHVECLFHGNLTKEVSTHCYVIATSDRLRIGPPGTVLTTNWIFRCV